jgi:L-fuculose-phosphate aldolase
LTQTLDSLEKDIIEFGRRLFENRYVAASDGNISARIDQYTVLITPTLMSKGFMKSEDLCIIDRSGRVLNGEKRPSSETEFHLSIYRDRPDVNSVCHAHPPYATAFAVAGIPLDKMVLPEAIIRLGTVPIADYATPGTGELYHQISKHVKNHDAILLANHGALTVGSSVADAYEKMETLEHAAMIQFIAYQLGRVNTLSKDQVGRLIPLRKGASAIKDLGLEQTEKSAL